LDRREAEALLRNSGLASLDRRWWCRLPAPGTPAGLSESRVAVAKAVADRGSRCNTAASAIMTGR
jgi:hypothetical protein